MQAKLITAARVVLIAALLVLAAGSAAWHPAHADQVIHIVQPGENLFRIGLQYGVAWTDIMRANGLASTTIYVGQQLVIPVAGSAPNPPPAEENPPAPEPTPAPPPAAGTYVVQRGDTLSTIAQRFGLTTAYLASVNNIANPSLIYAGQVLTIPGGGTSDGTGAPPPAAGANKLILVDISEQQMYVYQDGALIYQWIVSTGEPGRDTRPGNYSVLNKIPNAYGATWNIWMPNWLGVSWSATS